MAITRMIHLCRMQIKELFRTPIFYVYVGLFFVYYHYLNQSTVRLQQESGMWVNAWGYTAGVFSNYLSTLAFGLGAVMLFSDLPLIREYALFESVRCSRNEWVGGRIMYVICVSVLYTFIMMFLCVLTCRGRLTETESWGKLLNTIANGYHFPDYSVPVDLSTGVTGRYTPLQAFGLTAGMGILASSVVGLVMLCLSLGFGRVVALSGASCLAVFDFVIYQKMPFWCYRLSPLSFTRLSIICNYDMPYYPNEKEALITLLLINAGCIVLTILISHWNKHFANQILKEQY